MRFVATCYSKTSVWGVPLSSGKVFLLVRAARSKHTRSRYSLSGSHRPFYNGFHSACLILRPQRTYCLGNFLESFTCRTKHSHLPPLWGSLVVSKGCRKALMFHAGKICTSTKKLGTMVAERFLKERTGACGAIPKNAAFQGFCGMSVGERVLWENMYLEYIFCSFQWVYGIWLVSSAWVCLELFPEESRSECHHEESQQPFLW